MQRSTIAAVLSIIFLTAMPGCGSKDGEAQASAAEGEAKAEAAGGEAKTSAEEAKTPAAEGGEVVAPEGAEAAGTDAAAEAGAAEAGPSAVAAEAGAAEAGAAEAGAAEAGEVAAAEAGEVEDPIPPLFELAKSLDNDDDAAKKALADALAAGAAKLDAAKAANERGMALMTKGESERAEAFFVWASETHTKYADPVYNLAKLAAYAGDLDVAKEHLAELQKRGNKKLMKKVGVEGAFAPLHDDPDVRKIYEQ